MSERPGRFVRLRLDRLEGRRTPAITFRFDFTYDTAGFFTPDARAALARAGAEVGGHFQDALAAVVPSGTNTWQASFVNTLTGRTVAVANPAVAADEVLVYTAGGPVGGELAVSAGGTYTASGSAAWLDTVKARGQPGALAAAPTDTGPWGGFTGFDSGTNWNFTAAPPGPNQYDFASVARHELLHILGFGLRNPAYTRLVSGGTFTGPAATAAHGGPVPLAAGDTDHWAPAVTSGGQAAIMVPTIPTEVVRSVTPLDFAAMRDVGWQATEAVSPPATPPTSPPPASPSPAASASVVRFAVGGGEGAASTASAVGADGRPLWTAAPFGTFTGGVRAASADFNGDGVADVAVGTGPGTNAVVRVLDGRDGTTELFNITPFDQFGGGVFVAAGDVNGDGTPDLVITPDQSGGPRVKVISGKGLTTASFTTLNDFIGIGDPNFRGGARAAVGDLNGDKAGEVIVSAGFGGGPRIAVYDGNSVATGTPSPQKMVGDFFAFEEGLRNGAYVAAGDLDGDGRAEVVFGAGPGGGPRVSVLSGAALSGGTRTPLADFFAGDVNNRGGVRVTAADVNRDGTADVVTGAGSGAGSRVTVYDGRAIARPGPPTLLAGDFYPGFAGGVFVG